MYCLMYFDVEDFFSPPGHPVHRLPGQFAEIMEKHGLQGSFHIVGEKARFMERHNQRDVIDAISRHDVSLHYDRGSIHPTTAEEVSRLDWFQGVDRAMFRELPGFQSHARIFGKCSAITRHGSTFATQVVYAAGKMGKPFFSAPFNLPGRNVAWFCNNLCIATGEGGSFDRLYQDTPAFEAKLDEQRAHLHNQMGQVDLVPLFGCHPLITIMDDFPCGINFLHGATPPPSEWRAPNMLKDASIPTIMANFERRIKELAAFPGLQWTTVGEIAALYSRRPVRICARLVEEGARAVVARGGPIYTDVLSAGELLYLLARRRLAPEPEYAVPQIMGPVKECASVSRAFAMPSDLDAVSREIIDHAHGSGYLPQGLGAHNGAISLEAALLALACDATDSDPASIKPDLDLETMPGVAAACANVDRLKNWRIHAPDFNQQNISKYFRWQIWTLKPAFRNDEYGPGIETGSHLNPALPF